MTEEEIRHITYGLMYKWAIIFYLCVVPFRYWAQNRALQKIKAMLQEGEEIILRPNFIDCANILLPIGIGGFLGCGILPFYLYPEIGHINIINRTNLPIWIIFFLIGIFIIFYISCWNYIITNKRLITGYSFDFIYKFAKSVNLNFTDIKSIEFKQSFWIKNVNIFKQNGEFIYFSGLKDIEKIKSLIEGQIKIQKELISKGA